MTIARDTDQALLEELSHLDAKVRGGFPLPPTDLSKLTPTVRARVVTEWDGAGPTPFGWTDRAVAPAEVLDPAGESTGDYTLDLSGLVVEEDSPEDSTEERAEKAARRVELEARKNTLPPAEKARLGVLLGRTTIETAAIPQRTR